MKLDLYRYAHGKHSTLGVLLVDGRFACYTVEDACRDSKVQNETSIPEGRYPIALRTEGGMIEKYKTKFPGVRHPGMLWVQNISGFQYVYIHIGNTDADTEGCILVGSAPVSGDDGGGQVSGSTAAYLGLYPRILAALEGGDKVLLQVHSLPL